MRILRFIPLAALLISASSCSMFKRSYQAVAHGTQATWKAVAGAGSAVVGGTAKLGQKTVNAAGNLVGGKIGDQPTLAEMTVSFGGKRGAILIALDEQAAPRHAENFRKLVKDNYYSKQLVHRAVSGYLIQTGDPRSRHNDAKPVWGLGGPGYTVPAEIGLRHVRGSVGMARLGDRLNPTRQSNGSQFYICLSNLKDLDGQYTVFAHVVAGLEVADAISNLSTDENDVPETPVVVESVRMVAGPPPAVTTPPKPASKPAPMPPPVPAPPAPAARMTKGTPPPAAAPAPALQPEAAAPPVKKGFFRRMLNGVW